MTVAAEKFSSSREVMEPQKGIQEPFDGESVAGFFLRLAELSGSIGPSSAAKRFGVTLGELRWGPRQRRGNSARLCGHQIPLEMLDLNARRVCPSCVEERRFVREWWEISILTTCPIHGVAMRGECACGEAFTWDDRSIDGCGNCYGLGGDVTPLPPKNVSPLEDLIARRVGIVAGEPLADWIEVSTLSFLLRLFEKVGTFAATGYAQVMRDTEADFASRIVTMERGLLVLQSEQFEAIIDRSVDDFRSASDIEFCKRPLDGLGWFGDWVGDEQLPRDHPFALRIKTAMESSWGCDLVDLQRTGVMHISVLGDRLKLPRDMAVEAVCRHLGWERMRGDLVPTAIAAEIEATHRSVA